jgi:hypothetical protein
MTTGPGCRPAAIAWTGHRLSPVGEAPAEPSRVKALVDLVRDLSLSDSATCSTAADGREVLAGAVRSGQVSVAKARVCVAEMARLESLLLPDAVPAVWAGYTDLARTAAARQLYGLRPFMLTHYGLDERLELDADQAARFVSLSAARVDGALFHYRLTLDAEQHAVLEAAVGALSAPCPDADGAPDDRSAERRRGEALAALVGRAVRAGNGTPVQAKSQLLLTTTVREGASGQGMVGPGTVIGSVAADVVLPPSTLRRYACTDGAFGLLFGVTGADLALGRRTRYFTSRQRSALTVRDGHCTYPGCSTPATWCDGHHLVHWLDGGPTDLANAALLCGRHHTLVHRRRLPGRLDPTSGDIVWDLDPGSYDRSLAEGKGTGADESDRP